jgi:hypothetical protein
MKNYANCVFARAAAVIDGVSGKVIGSVSAVGVSVATLFEQAQAAVPASVTTGLTTATTDVGTVGEAVLGVLIVIFAFALLRKVMH